jgi:hypothetical protein
MLENLKIFKGLNNMEKVFSIKEFLPEFIHFYERARHSMEFLERFIHDRGLIYEEEIYGRGFEGIPLNHIE